MSDDTPDILNVTPGFLDKEIDCLSYLQPGFISKADQRNLCTLLPKETKLTSKQKESFIKNQSQRSSMVFKDTNSNTVAVCSSYPSPKFSPTQAISIPCKFEDQPKETNNYRRPRLFIMKSQKKKAAPVVELCEATATTGLSLDGHIDNNSTLVSQNEIFKSNNSLRILSSTASSTFSLQSSLSHESTQTGAHGSGWVRVYTLFSSWMGKSKRVSEERCGKRLSPTRLEITKKRMLDAKMLQSHTEAHLRLFAPLFTLRLITILFSDEEARMRLEKQPTISWGLRRMACCEYVEVDAPLNAQKGPRMIGQAMSAPKYVTRVVKECWKAILKIGRGKSLDAQQGLWFLRQFCILYGFGVIKLKVMTIHMLPQLLAVAAISDLLPILPYNEDTIYALEKYQKTAPGLLIRRSTLKQFGVSDTLGHRRSKTMLLPSPLSIQMVEEAPTSKVTLERVVLFLMECFTRSGAPTIPEDVFAQLLTGVPCGPSVTDILTCHEIHVCTDFLLKCNSIISPSRWFRESCDLQQLELMNQCGLEACYLPKIDPRLVATHLKHVIASQGGLVPVNIARAIMALFPTKSPPDDPKQWQIGHATIQALESILIIPLFQFQLLKQVVRVAQHIIESPGCITGQALAVVFPVVPAHSFTSMNEVKHWNLVWGCILDHSRLLFNHSDLYAFVQPAPRVKEGYRYALELLAESGVKFLK
ncbi:hypothetical protein DSO57_1015499 [Entomophthora muscae]|uniref:Uncharacterized protein n=1 Tax=Entomophthora muscae TaxID=34485 RepID=A0ACC2UEM0_9FUNG|nr:hypothetical protein DSO57_1015499 [Entomophthora muscae]